MPDQIGEKNHLGMKKPSGPWKDPKKKKNFDPEFRRGLATITYQTYGGSG